MKIQGRKSQPAGPMGPFGMPSVSEPASTEPVIAGDSVELASATQVQQLNQMVQAMPTVRAEKVEGLRDAIEEGSYHVESDKLAKKVVDDVLSEALLAQRSVKEAF